MKASTLARWEHRLRLLTTKLPSKLVVSLYSKGRLDFLEKLKEEFPEEHYILPEDLGRTLWGIRFRSPIMNSAGMFKNGECYHLSVMQGAGAYIGGTGTWNQREGNKKEGIYLPFVPYAKSHAASNWLGLPNDGDEINSERLPRARRRINGCPLGWSVMGSPDIEGEEKLWRLVDSMLLYEPEVDFLEINESCPNTSDGTPQDDDLENRLRYIKERFLDERTRTLPVIVKFSNDTEIEQVPQLLDLLFNLGFDGVNFGNTSTDYAYMRSKIRFSERGLYDFYTKTFGGGVSGVPLKERSLALCTRAVEYRNAVQPTQEFHVIRTGGIDSWEDIEKSELAGVSLNQWFTGYFENFGKYGHDIYRKLFETALS